MRLGELNAEKEKLMTKIGILKRDMDNHKVSINIFKK
jgi:hypothetical protein